jgi:hypothetical protein
MNNMKKTILAIAIAATAVSAHAAQDEVKYTVEQKTESASVLPLNQRTWSLSGIPADVDVSHVNLTGDPRTIATAVIQEVRAYGYLDRHVRVDAATNSIDILQATLDISGPLKDYLPTDALHADEMNKRLPLIKRASAAYASLPAINVGKIENGVLPVDAAMQDKPQNASYGVTLSSYGSRYAGTDTATAFVSGSPVDGLFGSASYSYGLSDLREESKGGSYHGLNGSIEYPTPYGIVGASARYSVSEQGGIYLPLEMQQTVGIYSLDYIWPLEKGELSAHLNYVEQGIEFGAVDMESEQSYSTMTLKGKQQFPVITDDINFLSSGSVEHELMIGLDGKTDGVLLGDPADESFVKYTVDGTYDQKIHDFMLSASAGGQWTNADVLPSNERFYLGVRNEAVPSSPVLPRRTRVSMPVHDCIRRMYRPVMN